MKTNLAELSAFWNTDWTALLRELGLSSEEDAYYESYVIKIDGEVYRYEDDEPIDTVLEVKKELPGGTPCNILSGHIIFGSHEIALTKLFKQWRDKQNFVFLTIKVPKDKLGGVTAQLKAMGILA